jgi:hypothetical protein
MAGYKALGDFFVLEHAAPDAADLRGPVLVREDCVMTCPEGLQTMIWNDQ